MHMQYSIATLIPMAILTNKHNHLTDADPLNVISHFQTRNHERNAIFHSLYTPRLGQNIHILNE